MSQTTKNRGFTKSGTYLKFLDTYLSLTPPERANTFICQTEPGLFNYAVFPSPISLPPESQALIQAAEAVAAIVAGTNGTPSGNGNKD